MLFEWTWILLFFGLKKEILSDNDKKVRLQFARNMKQELIRNPDFWKNEISLSPTVAREQCTL